MTSCLASTLVVVGDDASFRYLIQRYADKSACHAVFVSPKDDITNAVLHEAPKIVVLELDFPDEWGWKVLRALKLHPETNKIPIIACSWSDESERSLDEGATVYLRKPILYDDFHAALIDVSN